MVAVFIFALHALAAVYAFFKYKKESISEGLLAVGFIAIVFSVGWTITTMLTNALLSLKFFEQWYYGETSSLFLQTLRKEINRDTIALSLLTFGECGFYFFFLRGEKEENSKEVTSA